jgi:hypothetical protein
MSLATGKICRERKGRDVYVVGAANVGKSAFVRAMLKVRRVLRAIVQDSVAGYGCFGEVPQYVITLAAFSCQYIHKKYSSH